MEKPIKPLRVSKGEATGYMAFGGMLVLLLIFFLLPLLGYHVSIGGGPFGG
jgi:cytochrome b561